jgi:hypothetical protein
MEAVCRYACAFVAAAIMASAGAVCAQDAKLSLPNVTVTAPPVPVEPPYMRDPGKAYARETLILADFAWRRINSPRCRARQPELVLAQGPNAYGGIG